VRAGVEEEQLEDLEAIGLDWDGPVMRQSERRPLYDDALEQLAGSGVLYPCWCSRREIREAASAPHGDLPEGAYPGTCRELGSAARRERERSGRPPALRLNAGATRVEFTDRLLGQTGGIVDDFVVRRGDGVPAYNLAVVVDDAAQGITEVVRGADLAESTPRQLHLTHLLGLPAPTHAHVPLLLGPDGARLAKRHGAVTLAERQARGETPRRVLGLLAHSAGLTERSEPCTLQELRHRFDPLALRGTGDTTLGE